MKKWTSKRTLYRRFANWILRIEEALFGEGIPDHWELVEVADIAETLIGAFPYAKILLVDRYYYLPTLDEVFAFLEQDETDKETYVSDFHDCDDFSFRLMGQFHVKPWSAAAVAIAWSDVHAYNVIIVTQDGAFIIEPQTDELIKPIDVDTAYETKHIFI